LYSEYTKKKFAENVKTYNKIKKHTDWSHGYNKKQKHEKITFRTLTWTKYR